MKEIRKKGTNLLYTYDLKLKQVDIKILNGPIKCNETDAVIKCFSTKKSPALNSFINKFQQSFKEQLVLLLLKIQ